MVVATGRDDPLDHDNEAGKRPSDEIAAPVAVTAFGPPSIS